jgi:hypothetical protein
MRDLDWRRRGADGAGRSDMKGALAGPTLVGLPRFWPFAQVSSGPQHFLLIGLPILSNQFRLSLSQF